MRVLLQRLRLTVRIPTCFALGFMISSTHLCHYPPTLTVISPWPLLMNRSPIARNHNRVHHHVRDLLSPGIYVISPLSRIWNVIQVMSTLSFLRRPPTLLVSRRLVQLHKQWLMLKRQRERGNARWRKNNVDKREAVSERTKTVSRLNPKGFLPLPLLTSRLLRQQ